MPVGKIMTLKRDARGRLRNYRKEYLRDHASIGARAKRAALGVLRKKLNVKKGEEVSHKKSPKKGGSLKGLKNIRVVSRRTNRKQGMKTITDKVKKAYKKKAARR